MSKSTRVQKSIWTLKRRSAPAFLALFIFTAFFGGFLLAHARFDIGGFTQGIAVFHPRPTSSVRRIFDGSRVAVVLPSRFAVVIDNLADARPQAGIGQAGMVIEAPAEAGITRWLAFFEFGCQLTASDCLPEKIGPVRSLRPYFLELAEGYRTPIAHVGGSPEALSRAGRSQLFTMNEFSFGQYFFRDPARVDPHRVFTSAALLQRALEHVGVAFDDLLMPWTWKEEGRRKKTEGRSVDSAVEHPTSNFQLQTSNFRTFRFVNYPPPPETEISWTSNPATEMFERRHGNVLQRDTDGAVIAAKTVFVLETSVVITDAVGRRRITTTGTGTAWRLTPTGRERLIWKRAVGTPFSFTTSVGKMLEVSPGKVWITIVPAGQQIIEN